jgi:putative hydrolase of the HAD superfamily
MRVVEEGASVVLNKTIFWDFDGTLGYRRGGMWGASMIEALRDYDPNTSLVEIDFREFLNTGFPWHHPEKSYTHIATPDEWWQPILKKFHDGFVYYKIPSKDAVQLAINTKERFLNPTNWSLFDDAVSTLQILKERGWKHTIVSNHIPELYQIVKGLGIVEYIDCFINSAIVGYEKPHPEIFKKAMSDSGQPNVVWMIGDNIEADVLGAEAVGIKSILVRKSDLRAKISCKDIHDTIKIIEGEFEEGINFS